MVMCVREPLCALVVVLVVTGSGVVASAARHARQTTFPQSRPSCPSGQDCINLVDCPTLAALLNRRPRPTADDIRTLQRSLCGFTQRRQPLACCPSGISLPETTTPQPTTRPTVPTQPTTQPTVPTQPTTRPTVPTQPTSSPGNGESLLPSSCGVSTVNDNTRIFFGEDATIGEYPWIALLGFTSRFQPQVVWGCGGALINNRYVLTAGHCTSPEFTFNRDLTVIRLGEHDLQTEPDCQTKASVRRCAPLHQTFSPVEIIRHPTFNQRGTVGDDIALIRLNNPAVFNDFVRPVCLPSATLDIAAFLNTRQATVSGWGATEEGPDAQILQEVQIPFVSRDECNPHYNNGLLPEQICFGGDGRRDSCFGDSGGPVVVAGQGGRVFTMLGMVSFGQPSCGVVGVPAVYTNVASYRSWIVENLRA